MRGLLIPAVVAMMVSTPQVAMPSDWLLDDSSDMHVQLPDDASIEGQFSRFSVSFWSGADLSDGYADPERARSDFGAEVRHRLGQGSNAMWWGLNTRLGVRDPVEPFGDDRGWQMGISAGRGWSTGFDLRGRVDYMRSNGAAYAGMPNTDTTAAGQSWRARAELDYAWSEHWGLFAGLGYQRGDDGNSRWAGGDVVGPGWRSYRVSARTVTFTFGAQIDLGPPHSSWSRGNGWTDD
jgi:hypothetical protein